MSEPDLCWPLWPQVDERTIQSVSASLFARRWSISGPSSCYVSFLARAEADFAHIIGRRYCIATCNGSSAIVIALQALGIGPGARVLIPATTWVGCATAIHRTGASPVFVDAREDSPCMSVSSLQEIDPESIDAILAVHLYASHEDVGRLRRWAPRAKVIEDCSHCHGAADGNGRILGTLGDISIFSFQATKILTCGEGGAALTDDQELAERLAVLRADSRRARHGSYSEADLEPAQLMHGANYALSEIQAAVLCDQIERLRSQNAIRAHGAKALCDRLRDTPLRVVGDSVAFESGAFYGVVVSGIQSVWGQDVDQDYVIHAVERAVGARCHKVYPPVPAGPLYLPNSNPSYLTSSVSHGRYPHSERWQREALVIPHQLLLAQPHTIHALADALAAPTLQASSRRRGSVQPAAAHPSVTVVVLTRGRPERLAEALGSIAKQDYEGFLGVLVFGDNATYVSEVSDTFSTKFPLTKVMIDGWLEEANKSPFKRVPVLRNISLHLVETQLVCFLDDDNLWESNHVSSVVATMTATGVPAAHSWRRLAYVDGCDWVPNDFPWLPPGLESNALYQIYLDAGVFARDDPCVRDVASLMVGDRDLGMVDMGEWIFEKFLLDLVSFDQIYSETDVAMRVTEDDKLLQRFRSLGIPIACTSEPTLVYRLGGFSNGK